MTMMMPQAGRRGLKRDAMGSIRSKKNRIRQQRRRINNNSNNNAPVVLMMSPLELFFPIPESLLLMKQRQGRDQSNEADNNNKKPTMKKQVSFRKDVQIVEIESHRNYSEEVKQSIWDTMDAMRESIQRNRNEVLVESSSCSISSGSSGIWMESAASYEEEEEVEQEEKDKLCFPRDNWTDVQHSYSEEDSEDYDIDDDADDFIPIVPPSQ